jgi:ATP-dependent Clp protease adaptor protein ClpS
MSSQPAFATAPSSALRSTSSNFVSSFTGARVCTTSSAQHLRQNTRRPRPAVMQLGAPQTKIGRPKTSLAKNIGTVTNAPEKEPEAGKGAAKARPTRKTQSDEVPMYKVILLADPDYEEGHVATQLQKICQISKKEASSKFAEAQANGSSVVVVVPEEHAEFYAQQLKRADIYVTIEKDE